MKFTSDVQLLDPQLLSSACKYYSFVCDYMVQLADPEKKGHPLGRDVPLVFRALPEFFVEDVADFFLFLGRYTPENLGANDLTSLINFIVMFLSQPDYVKSPHLRSKLAEIIYMFTPDYQEQSGVRSNAEYVFNATPFVQKNLAKGLMDFYQGWLFRLPFLFFFSFHSGLKKLCVFACPLLQRLRTQDLLTSFMRNSMCATISPW